MGILDIIGLPEIRNSTMLAQNWIDITESVIQFSRPKQPLAMECLDMDQTLIIFPNKSTQNFILTGHFETRTKFDFFDNLIWELLLEEIFKSLLYLILSCFQWSYYNDFFSKNSSYFLVKLAIILVRHASKFPILAMLF